MQNKQPSEETELFSNHPLRLNRARGTEIACTAGTIWITVAGEAKDIFLRPGERHRLSDNRLTLVEAIGKGSVRLIPAPNLLTQLVNGILSHGRKFTALGSPISGKRI